MRRGWIKVIKQAIWGVGPDGVSEQVAPGQKTSERSPPAAAHHKISQRTARTNWETRGKRTENGQRARQTEFVPSHRIWGAGAKRKWLHARSPPGAHDHIAEGPSSRSKPGGGHCLLAIGCGITGSQNVAGRVLGPLCLRTLYSESRAALQAHPAVRARHSDLREPAVRSILSDRRPRQGAALP